MDFDSPEDSKDFPGLYASDESGAKSKKDDVSDGEHEKTSKKELLIGRRKEKKDKKCYATLGNEDDEAPTEKSKKLKAFKFSKSKEKREKSIEKYKDIGKGTLEKKKDKKAKEKKKEEKKVKTKENSVEVQELGEAQPIFGVPLDVAIERCRCHDDVDLPLVIRNCIDYLQDHLGSEHIHKTDGNKSKLQQLKKNYNNRESNIQDLDVQTASGLLKLFLKELPEPILTIDLLPRFEEAAALATSTEQEKELKALIDHQLPHYNKVALSWILLHLDAVTQNEKSHKLNAQNLAVLLSPALQMSHRLLITLLCYCSDLFSDVQLTKYSPPITSSSPNLPETKEAIAKELKKQESLLAQLHAEMHAGFVTKKREEQLWEVQRIITQLKRNLKSFERKPDTVQKSIEDSLEPEPSTSNETALQKTKSYSDDENSSIKTATIESNTNTGSKPSPQEVIEEPEQQSEIIDLATLIKTDENGFMMLPTTHPDYLNLIRFQYENQELLKWKAQLQAKITAERSEILRLNKLLAEHPTVNSVSNEYLNEQEAEASAAYYIKENSLLEQKKSLLAKDLFDEYHQLIQLEVELALQEFRI